MSLSLSVVSVVVVGVCDATSAAVVYLHVKVSRQGVCKVADRAVHMS